MLSGTYIIPNIGVSFPQKQQGIDEWLGDVRWGGWVGVWREGGRCN